MSRIKLGDRVVTADSFPYIIAEIGVNHEGSLDTAKRLIDLAKEGGADAAKFQSYKASKLAAKDSPSYWDLSKEKTNSQRALFQKYDSFTQRDFEDLAKHCDEVGIQFLSTPFDDDAVDFLDDLMPFYKIASADITNLPFLKKIAMKKKPIVLSTGASTVDEIRGAVATIKSSGSENVALLHCILNYPTPDCDASLKMIKGLIKDFPEHIIGYSDHTLPGNIMLPCIVAYLLGAVIIEKHFTNDKTLPGNDHYHAMDVSDLKYFCSRLHELRQLLGEFDNKISLPSEELSRLNARRSLVTRGPIKAGQVFTEENVTYKRPGTGISPEHWSQVIGQVARIDYEDDQLISWNGIAE